MNRRSKFEAIPDFTWAQPKLKRKRPARPSAYQFPSVPSFPGHHPVPYYRGTIPDPYQATKKAATKSKSCEATAVSAKAWNQRYVELVRCYDFIHAHRMTYEEMDLRFNGLGDWLKKQRTLHMKDDGKFMKEK